MKRPLRTLALELGVFTALAWYAAAHWSSGLVADAPAGRVFACVLIAVAVGTALSFAGGLPRIQAAVLRSGCVLAGFGAGLVAIGLDRGLLAPGRWDELRDGLDRGLAALGSVEWPYDGPEAWAATTLLLAVPLVVTAAAAFAFWPGGHLRPFALILLVALYGLAVTEHQFDGEIGRGIVLLLLTAAWLWLPRLPERGWQTAAAAAGAVAVACVVALPAAARYDDRTPLVNYESWNPFAADAATSFDWSHSYGPIDWPRDGTTLMNVRSDERHYWRVETLDRFDGFRWVRAGFGSRNSPRLPEPRQAIWETRFRVTIRDLDTDLFPIAGTMLQITGADPVPSPSEDGTVEALGESLDEGDSYTVDAYVPDPSPDEMRSAPPLPDESQGYVPPDLVANTEVFLPPPGARALGRERIPGDASRSAAPPVGPATTDEISASPYGRVLRLARRLARGQRTTYDVVRAVQSHLRSEYAYSERPPRRAFPLSAFLFVDRIGYCQQFSGAMALMLRMLGIPARVAAGFTPGSYNADTKEYRVRDLDAHSWVEVWFENVGWVPFDPTPSVAPADLQASVNAASASSVRGTTEATETQDPGQSAAPASNDGGAAGSGGGDDPALDSWMAIAALLLAGTAALAFLRVRALLGRRRSQSEEWEVAELRRVLARTGRRVPPRMTLRELELRLTDAGESEAARYARILRQRRFGAGGGSAPDGAARRGLRRALTRGRGPRARLAALAALPPLAFRRG
jgi:transglutaminase-like putative cysteine protease